jgi:hypothetical protein
LSFVSRAISKILRLADSNEEANSVQDLDEEAISVQDLDEEAISVHNLEEKAYAVLDLDEKGSAVAEFVLIATPLFLPALLFFLAMHSTATQEINVSHLARQAVRAFVTADDIHLGHQRVKFTLDRFSDLEYRNSYSISGSGSSERHYGFTYNISCSAEKCLEPGSLVEIKLYREFYPSSREAMTSERAQIEGLSLTSVRQERKVLAVARSYVDKWRSEP